MSIHAYLGLVRSVSDGMLSGNWLMSIASYEQFALRLRAPLNSAYFAESALVTKVMKFLSAEAGSSPWQIPCVRFFMLGRVTRA